MTISSRLYLFSTLICTTFSLLFYDLAKLAFFVFLKQAKILFFPSHCIGCSTAWNAPPQIFALLILIVLLFKLICYLLREAFPDCHILCYLFLQQLSIHSPNPKYYFISLYRMYLYLKLYVYSFVY